MSDVFMVSAVLLIFLCSVIFDIWTFRGFMIFHVYVMHDCVFC